MLSIAELHFSETRPAGMAEVEYYLPETTGDKEGDLHNQCGCVNEQSLHKITKNRGSLPSDEAVGKPVLSSAEQHQHKMDDANT